MANGRKAGVDLQVCIKKTLVVCSFVKSIFSTAAESNQVHLKNPKLSISLKYQRLSLVAKAFKDLQKSRELGSLSTT